KIATLNDIRKGYSEVTSFYIKHQTIEDECYLQELQDKYMKLALKRGVKTEREKLDFAIKKGKWSEGQENLLNAERIYLANITKNFDSQPESLKKHVEKDIEKSLVKVRFLQNER